MAIPGLAAPVTMSEAQWFVKAITSKTLDVTASKRKGRPSSGDDNKREETGTPLTAKAPQGTWRLASVRRKVAKREVMKIYEKTRYLNEKGEKAAT